MLTTLPVFPFYTREGLNQGQQARVLALKVLHLFSQVVLGLVLAFFHHHLPEAGDQPAQVDVGEG